MGEFSLPPHMWDLWREPLERKLPPPPTTAPHVGCEERFGVLSWSWSKVASNDSPLVLSTVDLTSAPTASPSAPSLSLGGERCKSPFKGEL